MTAQRFSNLSSTHQKLYHDFIDDYEYAATRIAWVVPGKEAGAVVKFIPTAPQHHVFQTIREIQAFRYVEQVRHLPQKERKEAWNLVFGRKNVPEKPGFRQAYDATLDFGAAKAIRLLRELTGVRLVDAIRMLLGKPRQIGGTAICTWIVALRSALIENHASLVVAHKELAAKYALSMIRRYFDEWSHNEFAWAFPGFEGRADAVLAVGSDDRALSTIHIQTAGGKDIRAPKPDFIQLDEYAHYDTNNAVDAIITAAQEHCWIIKNSTARGIGGQFYTDWQNAMYVKDVVEMYDCVDYPQNWNRYFRCFTPWWEDPRYVLPTEEGEDELILHTISDYERAWRDRLGPEVFSTARIKWRRDRVRQASNTDLAPEQFVSQEFPGDDVEMFQSSGGKPFDPIKLQPLQIRAAGLAKKALYLKQADAGPALKATPTSANLTVWARPKVGAKYVIGADIGRGLAHRDRSWAVVLERIDGTYRRQVAEWRGHIGSKSFAHVLALLGEWYNTAFICPTALPHTTAMTLSQDLLYPLVYRRRDPGRAGDPGLDTDSWQVGYLESGQSAKEAFIGEMIYDFENDRIDIVSEHLLQEMAIYSQDEKGRFGAPPGKHDDGVVALGMANWADSVLRGAPPIREEVIEPRRRRVEASNVELPQHEINLMAALAKEIDNSRKPGRKVWWR